MSSTLISNDRVYVRGSIVPFEENVYNEFKGHRTISIENRMPDFTTGEFIKTRQQWSKYLCGMLNSGVGGVLYGGILDDGEVNGFMLSLYQIDHISQQIDDLLQRFSPPVPKHLYKVEFVPQIEPSDSEYTPDPGHKDPSLEVVPHKFRSYKRCWCDNDAAASHSFGILLQWYIVEVTIHKQNEVEYKAEDNVVYIRRHGMTETKYEDSNVRCDRCGNIGHFARRCSQPRACYKCGDTGHLEARCSANLSRMAIKGNHQNKHTSHQTSKSQQYCQYCEKHGHGIRECPEMLEEISELKVTKD